MTIAFHAVDHAVVLIQGRWIWQLNAGMIQEVEVPSNDTSIEWEPNTFDAANYINMYRVLMIFISFESAWEALLNGTKIIEPEKKFAVEVITVDVLDMEGMTMESKNELKEKIEVKEDKIPQIYLNSSCMVLNPNIFFPF